MKTYILKSVKQLGILIGIIYCNLIVLIDQSKNTF